MGHVECADGGDIGDANVQIVQTSMATKRPSAGQQGSRLSSRKIPQILGTRDELVVAAGNAALQITLKTSEGREDSAILQAYDSKRKRMCMERDAGTRCKPVLIDEWHRQGAEN